MAYRYITSIFRHLGLPRQRRFKTLLFFAVSGGLLLMRSMSPCNLFPRDKDGGEDKATTFKITKMAQMESTESNISGHNMTCHCMEQEYTIGRCSNAALRLGPGQKVISYSLFGKRNTYDNYLDRTIFQIRKLYPGWVMRIYSDYELQEEGDDVCRFVCNNPSEVFWCDVRRMRESDDIMKAFGMTWRFVPIDDPLVDTFLSRDLDANIMRREREAVFQWENSDYVFHFMRDNRLHNTQILGGMWGAKVNLLKEEDRRKILVSLLRNTWTRHMKGIDQEALTKVIYVPEFWNMSMAHDAYLCKAFDRTLCIDFPSPRYGDEFVPMNNECTHC